MGHGALDVGLRITVLRDCPFDSNARFTHKYGGKSLVVDPLPDCSVCRRPLRVAFEFDLRDPALAFLKLKGTRLPILTCCDCDLSYAGMLFYRVTDSGIRVISTDATTTFEHWATAFPERGVAVAPVPVVEQPSHYSSLDEWDAAIRFASFAKHQLGGTLLHVQDEMTMSCPECRRQMRVFGQIDSETWEVPGDDRTNHGHMFGDMGMLYVVVCDACGILGTGGSCY